MLSSVWTMSNPKLDYTERFPSSLQVVSSSCADVFHILGQVTQPPERDYYYWLVSHFSRLSTAGTKVTEMPPNLRILYIVLQRSDSSLKATDYIDTKVLTKKIHDFNARTVPELDPESPRGSFQNQ